MWAILHILCCQRDTVFSIGYWETILHEMRSFDFFFTIVRYFNNTLHDRPF
jgi:hypothetical protein